jgi:copper chaperone CopZ
MDEWKFSVPDLTCLHCVRELDEHLRSVQGVRAVAVDWGSKTVRVRGVGLDWATLEKAVEEAGFEAERLDSRADN